MAAQARRNPRVAFLGPLASFSHQAALGSFGKQATLLPQPSFDHVFAAVQSKEADYAVLPLENSTDGSVVQAFDLLADREKKFEDLEVCAEYYLPVHLCFLLKKGTPGTEATDDHQYPTTTIYSHPQVWGQCTKFLSKFKEAKKIDVSSTAKAAEIVAHDNDPNSAAIASRLAAEMSGLNVEVDQIEDEAGNTTRFLILRNKKQDLTDVQNPLYMEQQPELTQKSSCKSLILLTPKRDAPGSLAEALLIFKSHGIDLTVINTRHSGARRWEYIYFVECLRIGATFDEALVHKILAELADVTESCRYFGSWRSQLD
ncbi:prephenate dehydratase [Myotisia sp. PD_48]|nr:prephenate dehydratase [Myotisia sp. PD_48]